MRFRLTSATEEHQHRALLPAPQPPGSERRREGRRGAGGCPPGQRALRPGDRAGRSLTHRRYRRLCDRLREPCRRRDPGLVARAPRRHSVLDRFPNAATDGTFGRWTVLIAEQGRSGEEARATRSRGSRSSACAGRRAATHHPQLRRPHRDARGHREKEATHRNRRLMGAADEGLLLLDSVGRISSANRAAESILGVSLDGLIGRTHFDPRWQALREDGSVSALRNFRRPSPSPRGSRFVARSSASVTRAGERLASHQRARRLDRPAVPHSRRPWRSRTATTSQDGRGRGRRLRGAPSGDGGRRHALGPLPAGRDHHRGVRGRGGPRRLLVRRTGRPTLRRGGPPG